MPVQGSEELFVLNRKLDELIDRYTALKKKAAELSYVNEELRKAVTEKDERIKDLETKYDRIKLSGALLGEGENALEAKRKISELVREIDRCVALLNR
jgi:predicted  nucleic acid-binding Zn-ribbon protein